MDVLQEKVLGLRKEDGCPYSKIKTLNLAIIEKCVNSQVNKVFQQFGIPSSNEEGLKELKNKTKAPFEFNFSETF